ncbi:glucose-repressible protein Grg1 [Staphylotrichum tortipilum]|uniref:Glucose-repressible protein Grg1 n=1 Tax=Staphylotrichum tortipilum TaxID=2831512 RepID=A0AAN6MMQ0_9PEZI|nr:glucose-repressible protein Grg1 [Staphylotrichum longicolle]
MENLKNAGSYVADKVQGAASSLSKEANKDVAKDSNAGIGTRLQAAGDAIGDKADEMKHNSQAELNKQKATHSHSVLGGE